MNILLVEDSRSDASLIMDFIAEEENAPDVYWVTDGQEALDFIFARGNYLNAKKPDMILLDLALPKVGGLEVLKELKDSGFSDIPIVILSTSDNHVDCKNSIKLGAADFFSKPYNLQGYENLVQQLMSPDFHIFRTALR